MSEQYRRKKDRGGEDDASEFRRQGAWCYWGASGGVGMGEV
jgi:hypothetical protein